MALTEQQVKEFDAAQAAIKTAVRMLVEDDVNFHAICTALVTQLSATIEQHPKQHVRAGVRGLFAENLRSGLV